jgi:Flp pilus assembly protein TadB
MNETLVAAAQEEAPNEAKAAFTELYRSSRDDVYAYVAGLLGDRVAREDVTAQAFLRFASAREWIGTFTETRNRLLSRLEEAGTEAEQESIRRGLRIVSARLESARDDLARARQRVRMVPVTVTIAADRSIRDGGGWGVGDALDDAGRVLTLAAGVILVSAAVLLPLAILVAIAWLVASRARRIQRDRALDSSP